MRIDQGRVGETTSMYANRFVCESTCLRNDRLPFILVRFLLHARNLCDIDFAQESITQWTATLLDFSKRNLFLIQQDLKISNPPTLLCQYGLSATALDSEQSLVCSKFRGEKRKDRRDSRVSDRERARVSRKDERRLHYSRLACHAGNHARAFNSFAFSNTELKAIIVTATVAVVPCSSLSS